MEKWGIGCVEAHGCELGVETPEGDPIHKPWYIYSSNQHFTNFIGAWNIEWYFWKGISGSES